MCILLLRQEVHCSPLRKETGDSSQVCTSHSKRPFIKQYSLRASLVAQMVKNLCAMQVDLGSIPESARSPDEENGNPLQYSCLENSRDRGAWRATVHGIAESDTTEETEHAALTMHLYGKVNLMYILISPFLPQMY